MNDEEEIPEIVESGGKYWVRDEKHGKTFTELQLNRKDKNFRNVSLDKAVKRIFKK